MKAGTIILISYPFSDLSSSKVRPALVLTPEPYNASSNTILCAMITSNTKNFGEYDVLVSREHSDFKKTGLKKSSVVRFGILHSLHKSLGRRRLGNLSSHHLKEVVSNLHALLTEECSL